MIDRPVIIGGTCAQESFTRVPSKGSRPRRDRQGGRAVVAKAIMRRMIDTGQPPGSTTSELSELAAARKKIAEWKPNWRSTGDRPSCWRRWRPQSRFEAIKVMAAERLPVQAATRVLNVSESGYYEWRDRAPSVRDVRHAWLIEQIEAVHTVSKGRLRRPQGARRTHPWP